MFFSRPPPPSPPPSSLQTSYNNNIVKNYLCPVYNFVSNNSPDIWTGNQGLKVYEEIHQNDYNRLVHVLFLPGVFYGVFRAFPAMPFFPFNRLPYYVSIIGILMMYTLYYASFDPEGAFYAFLFNLPSATLAGCHIYQFNPKSSIKVGLSTMLFSLTGPRKTKKSTIPHVFQTLFRCLKDIQITFLTGRT